MTISDSLEPAFQALQGFHSFVPEGDHTIKGGFTYQLENGFGTSDSAFVTLTVQPLDDPVLGARVFDRHGSRHFRNAALLSLAVIGVLTLLLAARDYFG